MTKKQIIKVAQDNNINTDRMKIYKRGGLLHIEMAEIPAELIRKNLENSDGYHNIPEIDRLIRRYNRQAARLVAVLRKAGTGFCGFKAGSGEWYYREGGFTHTEELAFANMD